MKRNVWIFAGLIFLGGVIATGQAGAFISGIQGKEPGITDSKSPLAYLHNQYMALDESSSQEKGEIQERMNHIKPFEKVAGEQKAPDITADTALVMDLDTKQMLYQKRPYQTHKIASITKLMTAMLILDQYEYGSRTELTMNKSAFRAYGGNYIRPGDTLSVEELLHAVLMSSSNDAAARLAQRFGGEKGEVGFVQDMNAKAEELGLYKTRFANAHGLNSETQEQYSTAFDVMQMGRHMYEEYPTLGKILGVEKTQLTTTDGRDIPIANINKLLGKLNTEAGKTGYTDVAGETFFTVTEIDGRDVGVVVLGSAIGKRFIDTRELIEWTRENYKTE